MSASFSSVVGVHGRVIRYGERGGAGRDRYVAICPQCQSHPVVPLTTIGEASSGKERGVPRAANGVEGREQIPYSAMRA